MNYFCASSWCSSRKIAATVFLTIFVAGCNSDSDSGNTDITAPSVSLTISSKHINLSWGSDENTHHYRVLENPDGSSGYSVIEGAERIEGMNYKKEISVHLTDWSSASYIVSACDSDNSNCVNSPSVSLSANDALSAIALLNADTSSSSDYFGESVVMSSDGNTLVVGAPREDSSTTGINSTPNDLYIDSGAVYVFVKNNGSWSQQAYLKASNTGAGDGFGNAIAVSADGNTIAVGARYEDSSTRGVTNMPADSQSDNDATRAGAVYIFSRDNGIWSQQAYVKASNTGMNDQFGTSLALDQDGDVLAVGAYLESSDANGVNGSDNNDAVASGATYVFTKTNGAWAQEAYIKASNSETSDAFGYSVDLSDDGATLAVGAFQEASTSTGVNGDQSDNSATYAGAVYLFNKNADIWSQTDYIKASNVSATKGASFFGSAVSLSGDASLLAVGASSENSYTTGVNSTPDYYEIDSGAAYIFRKKNDTWAQEAYMKASNTGGGDRFGSALSLSTDGSTLAVGAYAEDSNSKGINGVQSDDSARTSGAAYLYVYDQDTGWSQKSYIKASDTEESDSFGVAVSLDSEGKNLAIGARKASLNTDIVENGAVYLY